MFSSKNIVALCLRLTGRSEFTDEEQKCLTDLSVATGESIESILYELLSLGYTGDSVFEKELEFRLRDYAIKLPVEDIEPKQKFYSVYIEKLHPVKRFIKNIIYKNRRKPMRRKLKRS